MSSLVVEPLMVVSFILFVDVLNSFIPLGLLYPLRSTIFILFRYVRFTSRFEFPPFAVILSGFVMVPFSTICSVVAAPVSSPFTFVIFAVKYLLGLVIRLPTILALLAKLAP